MKELNKSVCKKKKLENVNRYFNLPMGWSNMMEYVLKKLNFIKRYLFNSPVLEGWVPRIWKDGI